MKLTACKIQVLNNAGISHPLYLKDSLKIIGVEAINYFLEYICTPDVMKLSFLFSSKQEIEDCRVSICTYLIESDVSKDSLVNEVKEIAKKRVIRQAVTQVDQSRIYADLSSFIDSRSNAFRTVFEHYLDLKKNDYSSYSDEKKLKELYSVFSNELFYTAGHKVHLLDLTLNEKNDTFHKLISMLRDEFTFGDKGLNIYLSTRIRHGVLPSTIRTCATKEYLITPIQSSTKIPKKNEYWKNELPNLSTSEWSKIQKTLNKFTTSFEGIIDEINDEWLQIVSLDQDIQNLHEGGTKNKALFNYSISSIETYGLQELIAETDYENFVQVVTNWLWKRTEVNLDKIKNQIIKKAKEKFIKCYSLLSEAINDAVTDKEKVTKINDAISRSKESLHPALNLISTWFTRSVIDEIREFEIGTAIYIAKRPANVKVNFKLIGDEVLFKGKYLTNFVDILYILFENAASKSQLKKDDLDINVSLDSSLNDHITLRVTNTCLPISDFSESNKKLNYYKDALIHESIMNQVVQKEGGTGIFKIRKILSKDIMIEHSLDFGYKSNKLFEISISLKKPNGVICYENNDC